ncbi:hypothetical protein HU230_0008075 [Bradyrhizobium quebecense]|uniref:Uncharacterized protein n=1 Tax=Bradyrhizobium quebecense TaxID=2748629 RepID=A0A973WSL5_9BRAD|nr:hypothetical protein [Bradyrhizobium quebecense]UGA45984.1 hypothetical protein HU230_0008075 [Bradyrhizobium quebecense]
MNDIADAPARQATLSDQVALINPDDVAARIASSSTRFAIQASTIEIIAMARRIEQLRPIVDRTYDMLAFADLVQAQRDRDVRAVMRRELSNKVAVIGASLEAIGYGQPTSTQEEPING